MTCGPDPFSPVSADSISPLTGLSEPNQPGCAKPTPTAAPSSSSGFPACPSSPTSGSSTTPPAPSTCCTAATPASRSASPANAKARMIPDTCGPSSPDAFAFYDPASSSLKTSQGTLLSDSPESSPTLPKWGCMSGGALYERPTPGHPTDASGSSSLSTPQAADGSGGRMEKRAWKRPSGTKASKPLATVLALLPTPVAQDDQKQDAAHLEKKVASGAGETITSLTVMSRQYAETGAWSNKLLPTPTTDDANNTTRASGDFLSTARTLHGVHTSPQSDDGNTSSDEPHPGQLTIEDA